MSTPSRCCFCLPACLLALHAAARAEPTAQDYYKRGVAHIEVGNLGGQVDSLADFTYAILSDPNYADAYYQRGRAKDATLDHEGAIPDFNRAIELEPKRAEYYDGRGVAKQASNDLEGALADLNRAIQLDPKALTAYDDRGLAEDAMGDYRSAIADFTQAIKLDTGAWLVKSSLYLHRARARFAVRDFDRALADFKSAYLTGNGNYDYDIGQHAKKTLLAPSPRLPLKAESRRCDAWYYAGMKHLLAGEKEAAVVCFKQSVATGQIQLLTCQFAAAELREAETHDKIAP